MDWIPLFCFGFSGIVPGFDPFRFVSSSPTSRPDLIPSFVSGSPTSRSDLIPSFCFGFSCIASIFDPFVLFWVLRHHAQICFFFLIFLVLRHRARIRSLFFISDSLASLPNSIISFYFGFFGIVPGFDPFLFQVLRYRARIQSLCFVSDSPASHQNSILSFYFEFSGIVLGFPYLHQDRVQIIHLHRHRAQVSRSPLVVATQFC